MYALFYTISVIIFLQTKKIGINRGDNTLRPHVGEQTLACFLWTW